MRLNSIIIVLGSPNSPSGELSYIATSRLDLCFDTYQKKSNCQILCTGGWGEQFNASIKSHAFYARNYLEEKGVKQDHFLDFALSENTVEDALKAKEILLNQNFEKLIVITSDYHQERVRLIFDEILSSYPKEYLGAPDNLKGENLEKVMRHEKLAVRAISENGLYYILLFLMLFSP